MRGGRRELVWGSAVVGRGLIYRMEVRGKEDAMSTLACIGAAEVTKSWRMRQAMLF